jgi:ubiquitin-conjugating enzyme E2 T
MQKRLQHELNLLDREPPPGISAWPKDGDNLTEIEACIIGAVGTPYENGLFKLEILIPQRCVPEINPPTFTRITSVGRFEGNLSGCIC